GQLGDATDLGEVLVGAREVEEQVADRLQAKALEQFEAGRRDAERVEALPEWVGRCGVVISSHGRNRAVGVVEHPLSDSPKRQREASLVVTEAGVARSRPSGRRVRSRAWRW